MPTTLTKRAIKESFVNLLNERPLNKISVRDITDKCGINRNSFYYHYQDIPALMEEILTEQIDDIIEKYSGTDSLDEFLMYHSVLFWKIRELCTTCTALPTENILNRCS